MEWTILEKFLIKESIFNIYKAYKNFGAFWNPQTRSLSNCGISSKIWVKVLNALLDMELAFQLLLDNTDINH